MSLILVATVGGVLLEHFGRLPAGRTRGGTPGRSEGTRPATVRGPPTAVFDHALCQTCRTSASAGPGDPNGPSARGRHRGPAIGRGSRVLHPRTAASTRAAA